MRRYLLAWCAYLHSPLMHAGVTVITAWPCMAASMQFMERRITRVLHTAKAC